MEPRAAAPPHMVVSVPRRPSPTEALEGGGDRRVGVAQDLLRELRHRCRRSSRPSGRGRPPCARGISVFAGARRTSPSPALVVPRAAQCRRRRVAVAVREAHGRRPVEHEDAADFDHRSRCGTASARRLLELGRRHGFSLRMSGPSSTSSPNIDEAPGRRSSTDRRVVRRVALALDVRKCTSIWVLGRGGVGNGQYHFEEEARHPGARRSSAAGAPVAR